MDEVDVSRVLEAVYDLCQFNVVSALATVDLQDGFRLVIRVMR
jgi:hypothetical protein